MPSAGHLTSDTSDPRSTGPIVAHFPQLSAYAERYGTHQ
jgi:hypothetical protein